MAGQDNMVITNRIREEIGRFRKLQDHLRPTEVRLGLVAQQLPFRGKVAGQVSGDLEYRYGALRNVSADTHADTRFEMRIEGIAGHHVERNGAVREEDFAGFGIDPGRIGLEARYAQ